MGGWFSSSKANEYEEDEIIENEHHVEIGDQNAVKNMLDDTITELMQNHNEYVLHYGWDNVKLWLMVMASAVAAMSHFYRTPAMPERVLVSGCVVGFFAIHALLLVYTVFIEGDVIVRMSNKAGDTVLLKSSFPYTEDTYAVTVQSPSTPRDFVKQDFYVGNYFDADGYFDKDGFVKKFESVLARFEKQKAQ